MEIRRKIRKIMPFLFRRRFQNAFLLAFLLLSAILFFSAISGGESYQIFKLSVQKNVFLGGAIFVFLEMVSIVIAPVTTIFLIPVASGIFGPFMTSILSISGWTLGSIVAFMIARRFGRPLLEKMVQPEKLERYRKYISSDAEFLTVIILRVMLPVDVLSYAIGLFTVMRFRKYLLATIIGITPFSLIYSYGGEALILGNYREVSYIILGSVVFLLAMMAVLRKDARKRRLKKP